MSIPVSPPVYLTTGPTALHPLVAGEMARAAADGLLSESHRGARVRREVARTTEALRALLDIPADYPLLFVSSASEAMERIVAGTVRGRSFHFVNGAFARRFRAVATSLGVTPEGFEVPDGEGFGGLEPVPEGVDLAALTQNETSTGVRIPADVLAAIADRARAAGALVAVDLVSGWPTEAVDVSRIDAGFFSVQKGFGLPAGLGVIAASPPLVERARELRASGRSIGGYFDLVSLAEAAAADQTVATPNVLGIRLLGSVARAYLERGIGTLREAAEERTRTFWSALEDLPGLTPFVEDPEIRSRTLWVVRADGSETEARRVRAGLSERGLHVSGGYGPWKERHLRIANFPVQPPGAIEALLRSLREVAG